ncbi:hypothetical protein NDU88_009200 [Pleurodeles waltl]|uniref:Uncharacterized protein n=1 Tax=Pleurodeles waltl TaxID=8319 RepID=A0AAV7P1A0_PLEWA|nr:hypothetical protein NDU88_009200 [Pleurodeles waltl]
MRCVPCGAPPRSPRVVPQVFPVPRPSCEVTRPGAPRCSRRVRTHPGKPGTVVSPGGAAPGQVLFEDLAFSLLTDEKCLQGLASGQAVWQYHLV